MEEKRKILVIEDDHVVLQIIEELLLEENYSVKTAIEGVGGINAAINWKPDLIICDIAIPNKNGYEVLETLSGNEKTKRIPFIFLTAKVEREDLRKGMQLGADDYIFKPFDIRDLLNSIKVRLNKYSTLSNEPIPSDDKKYDINDKMLLESSGKSQFFSLKDLKFIKAETPYVKMKFDIGKSILHRSAVNDWEKKLPEMYFIRIHRSTIINYEFISKIEKISSTSYIIKLREETEPFVVSKRYSCKVRDRFT